MTAWRIDRRGALIGMGLGTAGLLGLPGIGFGRRHPRRSEVEDLSERLRSASHEEAFDVAAAAIRSGADVTTFLGAVFLAGLRDIRPRPHGILHTVMMVESAFQLGEGEGPRGAWLPALFNLDDLKVAQRRDLDEASDWTMPPRPDHRAVGADAARREFLDAMDAGEIERADRAVVALLPHCDRKTFFELVWPQAARSEAYLGHKIVYAAQVERVLERIGWEYAEDAARSLVMTVLYNRDTALFDRGRERAGALPRSWSSGTEEPARSAALVPELRNATPDGARELVIAAFEEGLGPATVWDALRLLGSEVFHRRTGRRSNTGRRALLPVHALTVTSAFGHAWRRSEVDETRRMLVLQAASLLSSLRDFLSESVGLSVEGPGLEALGAGIEDVPADLDELLECACPGHARVYLEGRPQGAAAYLAHLRRSLSRTGLEHHQHKYAATMQEEAARIHPRWRARILAPAVDYLANLEDEETEVYRRSARALTRAGVA